MTRQTQAAIGVLALVIIATHCTGCGSAIRVHAEGAAISTVAIEVALVAEESPALLDALLVAALRVLARWGDARTIAAPYGIDLPALMLPGLGAP